jgi:hypothetical protein
MKKINPAKTTARKVALQNRTRQPSLLKEIPHYLQILATARRHGIRFSVPAEAYKKMGVSAETAVKLELMRLNSTPNGKLTQKQIIELAKNSVKEAYRGIPNPTAVKRK